MLESDYAEKARYLQFFQGEESSRSGKEEEVRTTPLFSLAVKRVVNKNLSSSLDPEQEDDSGNSASDSVPTPHSHNGTTTTPSTPILPQYGLLGFHVGSHAEIDATEPILLNTNAPSSVFICGSQGSGKSYTLSRMLENCLLLNNELGILHQPVAGVVFHYDVDSTNSAVAEAASLCSRGIRVRVLVSPSDKLKLQEAYSRLPGAAENLEIVPLMFSDQHLSIERMLRLMAFSETEGNVPLYMEVIQKILRQMAIEGTDFTMGAFERLLELETFSPSQRSMMNMRLDLLRSFLEPKKPRVRRVWKNPNKDTEGINNVFKSRPGTLTIVDLSDPFIDSATVCVLFEICLGLVKEHRPKAGLVVALDEAHIYLNDSPAAANFTNRLLTTIREQRHNATRILIATQEPTLSSKLLDLCSVSIVHHSAWFAAIRGHLGGASSLTATSEEQEKMFESIVTLRTGESLVFAPEAFVCQDEFFEPKKLGAGAMKMRTRKRAGLDNGKSVLAIDRP